MSATACETSQTHPTADVTKKAMPHVARSRTRNHHGSRHELSSVTDGLEGFHNGWLPAPKSRHTRHLPHGNLQQCAGVGDVSRSEYNVHTSLRCTFTDQNAVALAQRSSNMSRICSLCPCTRCRTYWKGADSKIKPGYPAPSAGRNCNISWSSVGSLA
jgi:hypothetical protein